MTLEQAVGDTEVWLAVGVDVNPEMVGSFYEVGGVVWCMVSIK